MMSIGDVYVVSGVPGLTSTKQGVECLLVAGGGSLSRLISSRYRVYC